MPQRQQKTSEKEEAVDPVLESSWKCIGLAMFVPNPERFPSGEPQGQLTTPHTTGQHCFLDLCMTKSLAAFPLASFCQTQGGVGGCALP